MYHTLLGESRLKLSIGFSDDLSCCCLSIFRIAADFDGFLKAGNAEDF